MKRIIAVGAGAVIVLALTGCSIREASSDTPNTEGTYRLTSATVTLPSGKTVECVYSTYGGVDCDWDSVKETN